jgi:hypothetical protein
MNDSNSLILVTINVAPALEDTIVDWLLEHDPKQGFSSYRVDGHGSNHKLLSIDEQVRGRQRRNEFRLVLGAAVLEEFVRALKCAFNEADLFFFVTPVLQAEHLGKETEAKGSPVSP